MLECPACLSTYPPSDPLRSWWWSWSPCQCHSDGLPQTSQSFLPRPPQKAVEILIALWKWELGCSSSPKPDCMAAHFLLRTWGMCSLSIQGRRNCTSTAANCREPMSISERGKATHIVKFKIAFKFSWRFVLVKVHGTRRKGAKYRPFSYIGI